MSETAIVQVAEVKQGATGTSDRGQWTRYDLLDGNGERFATFSKSVYDAALPFAGKRAEVEYEQTEKGRKLISVKDAPADSNGDTPPLGTGQYVTGQKPPIEARRIFASTAWNNAVKLTALEVNHGIQKEVTPALLLEIATKFAQGIFDDLIRRGDAYLEEKDLRF